MGMKLTEKTTHLHKWATFDFERKGRRNQSEGRTQSPEGGGRDKVNASEAIKPRLNQGFGHLCLTGCKNYNGPVTAVWPPVSPYVKRAIYSGYSGPVPPGYLGWQIHILSSLQVFNIKRNRTQGTAHNERKGLHLKRFIYTWTWLTWWDLRLQTDAIHKMSLGNLEERLSIFHIGQGCEYLWSEGRLWQTAFSKGSDHDLPHLTCPSSNVKWILLSSSGNYFPSVCVMFWFIIRNTELVLVPFLAQSS